MPKAGKYFNRKDEWMTPKDVIDFFGPFDYDPATTDECAKKFNIKEYDTIDTDGLSRDWSKFEKIWCNPPFTKKFKFLIKAIDTMSSCNNCKIFFLLPAETITTKKYHKIIGSKHYVLWVPNGRIRFSSTMSKESVPAFGSVVLEFRNTLRFNQIKHWKIYGKNSRK